MHECFLTPEQVADVHAKFPHLERFTSIEVISYGAANVDGACSTAEAYVDSIHGQGSLDRENDADTAQRLADLFAETVTQLVTSGHAISHTQPSFASYGHELLFVGPAFADTQEAYENVLEHAEYSQDIGTHSVVQVKTVTAVPATESITMALSYLTFLEESQLVDTSADNS